MYILSNLKFERLVSELLNPYITYYNNSKKPSAKNSKKMEGK